MTTCRIGLTLGKVKEISTDLALIYCPSNERREGKQKLLSNNRNIIK
jgi:hypothetical protein